ERLLNPGVGPLGVRVVRPVGGQGTRENRVTPCHLQELTAEGRPTSGNAPSLIDPDGFPVRTQIDEHAAGAQDLLREKTSAERLLAAHDVGLTDSLHGKLERTAAYTRHQQDGQSG